jgi:UDP-glucuronate 4-epimerase
MPSFGERPNHRVRSTAAQCPDEELVERTMRARLHGHEIISVGENDQAGRTLRCRMEGSVKTSVITGCAGFIGSHLAERCVARGDRVIGLDLLTDYYDVDQKWANLDRLSSLPGFEFVETDLAAGFDDYAEQADVVFHQAGQPGVRASWRDQFDEYLSRNVQATQRVLEACVRRGVDRVVYASSSSVYGNAEHYPVDETMLPQPFSPYGVTKLAAEHLCSLYASNFGLSVVSLRYFTVYGPRQRPDMATHRLFEAALDGTPFPLFGTGEQLRDFTFVGDVVGANLLAAEVDVPPGLVANIAGGGECSMLELISTIEEIAGKRIEIDHRDPVRGDVRRTGGLTDVAHDELGWTPETALRDGLAIQHRWHLSRR